MEVGEKWMRWTLLEALMKTTSKLPQKFCGQISPTFGHTFLASLVIGWVQVSVGYIVTQRRGTKLLADRSLVIGSCLFGLGAAIITVLGFAIFYYHGDVGVSVLIFTLSIIPGAFIDQCFFGHRLTARKWAGVGVGILAAYVILNRPSLQEFKMMPVWIWLSFALMFLAAVTQGITQKIKEVDMFVKNFWGGLVTVVVCLAALVVSGQTALLWDFSPNTRQLVGISAFIGLVVVAMWSFNLLSYKGGASIAIKKLVLNGFYLTTAMLGGMVFFGETLTNGKLIGTGLYVVAFALMDDNTWRFLLGRFWKPAVATG